MTAVCCFGGRRVDRALEHLDDLARLDHLFGSRGQVRHRLLISAVIGSMKSLRRAMRV